MSATTTGGRSTHDAAPDGTPALAVEDLTLRFGQVIAFEDVCFTIEPGELFAVIGPNGAGKTSLFNVLSRVYTASSGSVRYFGDDLLALRASALADAGIARTFQNVGLFGELSAIENVLVGRHHLMRCGPLRAGAWLGAARREERAHRAAALQALHEVGIAEHADTPVSELPFGIQKRIEIARALAMDPRLLLLDEPVAGMSGSEREAVTELIQHLHAQRGITMLLVEHDMGMVMRVADRVLVLDFGRVIAVGPPERIQRDEQVIRAYLGAEIDIEGDDRATGAAT